MKIKNKDLISDLNILVHKHLNAAENYKSQSMETLNWKSNPDCWSILECIEHLNRYGEFYLPEIQKVLQNAPKVDENTFFKSGWLGNYSAESMVPKQGMKTMKTFKDKDPIGSKLDISVLDTFVQQRRQLLELLEQARKVNLSKNRTAITLSKLITLRLGDIFRFIINHDDRHIAQADRSLKSANTVI